MQPGGGMARAKAMLRRVQQVVVLGASGSSARQFVRLGGRRSTSWRRRTRSLTCSTLRAWSEALSGTAAQVVLNLVAWADVDGAEAQRGDEHGLVYRLNAELPGGSRRTCARQGKYLVHISTDYVFDGEQRADGLIARATRPARCAGTRRPSCWANWRCGRSIQRRVWRASRCRLLPRAPQTGFCAYLRGAL